MTDEGNIMKSEPAQDQSLKVASAEMVGGKLIVTVERASISKLIVGAARKLAYAERLKHGLVRAGIEAMGGTYVPAEEQERAKKQGRDVAVWRADFRITPMI